MSEMYNPTGYQAYDKNELFDFMDEYPFSTVISVHENQLYISHLPLTPKRVESGIELIGHLAKANPHWQFLRDSKTTVIFHGPHTYISPKWYAANDVPTWNYSTAHITGRVELIEDEIGILNCLNELTAHVERRWASGWEFYVPNDLAGDGLTKSIIGFRIVAEKINFKKKLSQNRSPTDRAGVLQGLRNRVDENSQRVLADMLKLYQNDSLAKKD